jgi:hypothetical protein
MDRHHKSRSAIRTEQERGLRIRTEKRDKPDLDALARLIAMMAKEDPLGLAVQPNK